MTIGSALGGVAGGIMGGVLRNTIIAIAIGIFCAALLDMFLVFSRDFIFNVTPEAYDAGFCTKVSVALAICLIPYLIYLAVWFLMWCISLIMFFFTAFQSWTWLMVFDPPNFLGDTIGIINDLLASFGV